MSIFLSLSICRNLDTSNNASFIGRYSNKHRAITFNYGYDKNSENLSQLQRHSLYHYESEGMKNSPVRESVGMG